MKQLFLIANWKSHMTVSEAKAWFLALENSKTFPAVASKTIIVCPPFTLLFPLKTEIAETALPVFLGAQTLSANDMGAFTGEVTASQIKELADYVLIGHSERRKLFGESEAIVAEKVAKALQSELTPIVCIQDAHTPIPSDVTIVAYEPVSAIGTGQADTPESAEAVAAAVKGSYPAVQHVLYGGSVTPENVHAFTQMPSLSGVLVGKISLDPLQFLSLIQNA